MKICLSRVVPASMCIAATMIVSPSFAGGSCPADINNDDVVDVSDLLEVIDNWGQCPGSCPADIAPGNGNGVVNNADLFAVAGAFGPCPGSNPPPPPGPLTPSGQVNLHDGNNTVANLAINGTSGIMGANDDDVGLLTVTNCTINSVQAGIYCGSCDDVRLNDVQIQTGNGGDNYSLRGGFNKYFSRDCSFISNGKSWRVYNCTDGGSSTDDVIAGGIMWVGGGAADGWQNQLPFRNFTFTRTSIDASSVEIMAATHHVTFNNCDFEGTHHISIHGPAHDITFNNCENLPEIREYGNTYNIVVNP